MLKLRNGVLSSIIIDMNLNAVLLMEFKEFLMSCLLILKEEWSSLGIQPPDKILRKTLINF